MTFEAVAMLASLYEETIGETEMFTIHLPYRSTGKPDDDISDDFEANEWYWQNIEAVDLACLIGPRHYPDPCAWCGGRLRHSKPCQDLRAEWQPTIPFGRYKGQRVCDADLLP